MFKNKITYFAIFILVTMIIVTTWASLHEDVFTGGAKVLKEPWGIATLFDAYYGFLIFYLWVLYKEQSLLKRVWWFIFIMLFGNIAMAIYLLIEVYMHTKNEQNLDMQRFLTQRW